MHYYEFPKNIREQPHNITSDILLAVLRSIPNKSFIKAVTSACTVGVTIHVGDDAGRELLFLLSDYLITIILSQNSISLSRRPSESKHSMPAAFPS